MAPFDAASVPLLPRRRLLRLAGAAAVVGLAGCRRSEAPTLLAVRGELPAAWAKALPAPWRWRSLATARELLEAGPPANLLALGDGWASGEATSRWQPLAGNAPPRTGSADGLAALIGQLDPRAAAVARLYRPEGSPLMAFPWAVAPWLLVLRGRSDLVRRQEEGWALLLDPSLRGRLVLPASPRVVVALADGDGDRLRQLRRQAMACNDRDALALLLNGDADAAVVPRQPVVPLLRRDPRLHALLLPGAPLSWSVLLRPRNSMEPLPLQWLEQVLTAPLLPRLLAAGWVPPLPLRRLGPALSTMAPTLRQVLLPSPSLWRSCVNLPPLAAWERQRLEQLWQASDPGAVGC
ncbi:MAG: twin-arginine translocation pathway signal [Cyanobacteriota bacterium]|nr:twin-arginine translocation pathway signal [Cyanobacteriota bacterium]